jgi:hypothetical protein
VIDARESSPVLHGSAERRVHAAGHKGVFKSPDGQDWIIYHANGDPDWKCTSRRAPYIEPFHWSALGTPVFDGTR